ncbi:hypothetical protein os1_04070 [Comamonadaceae bacterium OS-1]|nr:hypothetical protein os1_04070 [Comamonadaceae bacterium OS-1]
MTPYTGYEDARGWDAARFGAFTKEEGSYFVAELAAAGIAVDAGIRVLDIGFGNGSFVGWCRSLGATPHGTEVNPRLVERARSQGFTCAADLRQLQQHAGGAPYDLITAFDVLEHIDRAALVSFVAQIRSLCHPNTTVLLRFPNGDNPFALPLQNGDVTHLTAIGQTMVHQVAALAGFEVLHIGAPAQPQRHLGLKRALIALGLPLRSVIGLGIRHLFMGGAPVLFCANLLVTLRPARGVNMGPPCDD